MKGKSSNFFYNSESLLSNEELFYKDNLYLVLGKAFFVLQFWEHLFKVKNSSIKRIPQESNLHANKVQEKSFLYAIYKIIYDENVSTCSSIPTFLK